MISKQYDQDWIIANIIVLLQQHPRTLNNKEKCYHIDTRHCLSHHEQRIKNLVYASLPITFILPAFPAKSPNSEKTEGILPDLGETLALQKLNEICNKIQMIYPFGAQIIICSDGRVFNDLVMVSDDNVNVYAAGIKSIIRKFRLDCLTTFSLDDCYSDLTHNTMRQAVVNEFGEELTIIKDRVKSDEGVRLQFNGIHRFIYEDQLIYNHDRSKNQIRLKSKEITYQVIQRSNAWSNLLQIKFPDAIRLSIHPQSCGSNKLGIMLLESSDIWATPWHRVVLKQQDRYRLIKKKEAEALRAQPIFVNNEFSHYVI